MALDLTFPTLYSLRERLAVIAAEVTGQAAKLRDVRSAPAHSDDMAAALQQSLDALASDFETRLAAHLGNPVATDAAALLNGGAPLYFMRDVIAEQAPALVARLYPNSSAGMRREERKAALLSVYERLRSLWEERKSIGQELSIEAAKLKDARQEAIWRNDWKAQCSIEREQRQLSEDVLSLDAQQEQLIILVNHARV